MPRLLLGPMLRYVGEQEATIWVETDAPCTVEALGGRAPTFSVGGHHYALVRLEGLAPGAVHPYRVTLDGEVVWPEPGSAYPPSVIRTRAPGAPARVLFGSCRLARPHTPPYTLSPELHDEGRGVDALTAMAEQLRHGPASELPDLVLHLGDQVYSDAPPAPVLDFVRPRRAAVPGPAGEVVDFEEFAMLYVDAWSEPSLRWLLSTVPSMMMFDDHDVHDDWNTSQAWRREREVLPWWRERMIAALMTYWIYQHAGNLDLEASAEEGVLDRLERHGGDATAVLREHAVRAHDEPEAVRWSCRRDLGGTRVVAVDSRAGRVLEPGGRDMIDGSEWRWLDEQLRGDFDHVLIASTVPVLLPPALHDLEAWNERLCDGAWGAWAARRGEALRQFLDLEHWAAFDAGFRRLMEVVRQVAAGERGQAPATVCLLGGDVHFGYVAEVRRPATPARVYQLVASPMRNRLEAQFARAVRASLSPPARLLTRVLAAAAGAPRPRVRWGLTRGPWFENHVADLTFDRRRASLAIREAQPGSHPELRTRLLLRLG
jgi:PhoD-like phosphatase